MLRLLSGRCKKLLVTWEKGQWRCEGHEASDVSGVMVGRQKERHALSRAEGEEGEEDGSVGRVCHVITQKPPFGMTTATGERWRREHSKS